VANHHPSVEQYRQLVEFFFGQAGYRDEADYAMMVMWGESQGNRQARGPTIAGYTGRQAQGMGLFQHMSDMWDGRVAQAKRWWAQRGVQIGDNPDDPATNIAVAAWLRAVGGWGHWAVTYDWYKPGSMTDNTFWDGYRYQNMGTVPDTQPPLGDGQGDMRQSTGEWDYPFVNPVPGAPAPGEGGIFGADRDGGSRQHKGIDLSAAEGTPILATYGGRVVKAGHLNDSAGITITIDHGGGWTSDYMHITDRGDGVMVKEGDVVQSGQPIGLVGQTGNADGAHLHFQLRYRGEAVDPISLGVLGQTIGTVGTRKTTNDYMPYMAQTPKDRARALLTASLDAMSNAIAGGQRTRPTDPATNTLTGDDDPYDLPGGEEGQLITPQEAEEESTISSEAVTEAARRVQPL